LLTVENQPSRKLHLTLVRGHGKLVFGFSFFD
jgi:hypothetical protein